MKKFQNHFCACSAQPGQKFTSGSLFNTNMPAPLQIGNCGVVRDTYKVYKELLNKDNYVTVWFIVGINIDTVPHNQCCQVPIVEVTGQ